MYTPFAVAQCLQKPELCVCSHCRHFSPLSPVCLMSLQSFLPHWIIKIWFQFTVSPDAFSSSFSCISSLVLCDFIFPIFYYPLCLKFIIFYSLCDNFTVNDSMNLLLSFWIHGPTHAAYPTRLWNRWLWVQNMPLLIVCFWMPLSIVSIK